MPSQSLTATSSGTTLAKPRHDLKVELTSLADLTLWPVTDAFRHVLAETTQQIRDGQVTEAAWQKVEARIARACAEYREAIDKVAQYLEHSYGARATIGLRMVSHDALNAAAYVCSVGETLAMSLDETPPLKRIKEAFTVSHVEERGSLSQAALRDAVLSPFLLEEPSGSTGGLTKAYKLGSSAFVNAVFHSVLATTPGAERVGLFTRIPPVLAEMPVPRGFLVQEILRELIANSLRAMTESSNRSALLSAGAAKSAQVGVKIARVSDSDGAGSVWKFLITDTGPGLSDNQLALLNAGKLTTKRNGGQGVLLNRKAVEEIFGGTFQVRSVSGKGLAVHFTIPIRNLESVGDTPRSVS